MRLGVDVGGTNTDAVLLEGRTVRAALKRPTTADVGDGVAQAIASVLAEARIKPKAVSAVMIGTTHFTNAFIQAQDLAKVGVIRIGFPAARGVPPFTDWPDVLRAAVAGPVFMVRGGHQFDGREIGPLAEDEIGDAARRMADAGVRTLAISGVFSPLNGAHEKRAAEIVARAAPELDVTCSADIGRAGLLERENAAIMNASLKLLAAKVVSGLERAVRGSGVEAPFFVSQNDGTLIPSARVREQPVLTFAAGPTNSLRGSSWLSGMQNAIVADIGGTTTDVGVLVNGYPRQSSLHVDIGGVRTNFRMPDLTSIGLGGGSRVRSENGRVRVGPDSVGRRLTEDSLVFGGATLTASDIAVKRGHAKFGDAGKVGDVDPGLAQAADDLIHRMLEDAVDRMKTSAGAAPLILVGGGATLINRPLAGVSDIVRPDHSSVANAVGAAIGQIGADVDRIFSGEALAREAIVEQAREEAFERAVAHGAKRETLQLVELDVLPLQYLPGGAQRVVCRAVGDLNLSSEAQDEAQSQRRGRSGGGFSLFGNRRRG